MRAMITGANGFAGSHLLELLKADGHHVVAVVRGFRSDLSNLSHVPSDQYLLHHCDLTDEVAVAEMVESHEPTHIFHLAAQSYVPASWSAPRATMEANVIGTLNLLEAVRRYAPRCRVQVAGSSEEYGRVAMSETPIDEDQPLRPLSPYGVSKAACDLLARQYAASYGLHIVVTRAFNHSGPRRGKVFAESDWARRIAMIEAGLCAPQVLHGNLDAIRDLSDVRDIVRGYVEAIILGAPGNVYNLCSGKAASYHMREILDKLIKLSTKADIIQKISDPARQRPSDVEILIGNPAKSQTDLDWWTKINIDETLSSLLNYWRQVLHATGPEKINLPCG